MDRLGKNPGLLPVVTRGDTRHAVGVITPETLMQFVRKTWDNGSAPTISSERPAA